MISAKSTFSVRSNAFSGPLPTQLGKLTGQTGGFYSYSNGLEGTLPSQLGRMTDVKISMNFYENKITGTLPTELGGLGALTGDCELACILVPEASTRI